MSVNPETTLLEPQSIESLFASPDFQTRLAEWQEQRATADESYGKLFERFFSQYKDNPDISLNQARDRATADASASIGFFEDIYAGQEALKLRQASDAAAEATRRSQAGLVATGAAFGISPFATYGLETHARGEISPEALKAKVAETEQTFLGVDGFIREHTGELLTVLNGGHAYAGIIGEGGIDLAGATVAFPRAVGTKAYGRTIQRELAYKLYELDRLKVGTIDIYSGTGKKAELHDNWDVIRRIGTLASWPQELQIVVGDVVEGEPDLESIHVSDKDLLRSIHAAAADIGRRAMASRDSKPQQ